MESKYQCTRIYCEQAAVRAVRFSNDGEYCVTCGSNKKLKLWNPFKKVTLKIYSGHANDVLDVSSSCDQSKLASGSVDKTVILWDVMTGSAERRLRGHNGSVTTVQFNELAHMLVSGSQDNTVRFWDVRARTFEAVQTLSEAKDSISSVRVSDHEVLTACYDGYVRIYDLRAGLMHSDFIGQVITCANFTKDNFCTLVSCMDGSVKMMDKSTGELLGEYLGLEQSDFCLESCINFNDKLILSGSSDGKLWIWDLMSREVVEKLSDQTSETPITSVSVHPKKNCFLTNSNTDILLWQEIK